MQRFVCIPADPSAASFEHDLPDLTVSRSAVLRNAVAAAEDGPARLVLPQGASSTFVNSWVKLTPAELEGREGEELTFHSIIEGLQVRLYPPGLNCALSRAHLDVCSMLLVVATYCASTGAPMPVPCTAHQI